jgi:ABC-type multidrug transport system fused ATPase/permease subunit
MVMIFTDQETVLIWQVFFAITMSALAVSRSTSRSTDLTKVKSAVNSIFEIIDLKSKIDPLEKSGQTPKMVRGEVELRHVGFAYPRRPTLPIFKDLNLTVQAGKVSNPKPWACGIFFEHSSTKTTPKLHIRLRFSFTFTLASGQG